SLQGKRQSLQEKKGTVIQRKNEKESQKEDLAAELTKQDKVLKELRSNIGTLRDEINRKERQREALSKKIASMIAEKSKSMPSSPAVTALSSNFEMNKGKLPWPTSQGIIVRGFGQQSHPLLKNIKIENDGIDIQ